MGAFNPNFADWESVSIQGTYVEVQTLAKCFHYQSSYHIRTPPLCPHKASISSFRVNPASLETKIMFVCKFLADFNSNYPKTQDSILKDELSTRLCIRRVKLNYLYNFYHCKLSSRTSCLRRKTNKQTKNLPEKYICESHLE